MLALYHVISGSNERRAIARNAADLCKPLEWNVSASEEAD